jgi:hypothetical protein
MVGFQERLDEFMLVGGSLSKLKFPRTVVQTSAKLLEGSVNSQFLEVSIDAVGP